MTHVRTKDTTMHIEGPDNNGHYWLHISASGEACRIDLGRPRGMVETALLMAARVNSTRRPLARSLIAAHDEIDRLAAANAALEAQVARLVGALAAEHAYWDARAAADLRLQDAGEVAMDYPMPRRMTEAMRKADKLAAVLAERDAALAEIARLGQAWDAAK